ncbi:hypothetical protein B4Q13_22720, partial [Lacticaseibacillus rhamnosus]
QQAVQVLINVIGLQSSKDVIGGITTAEAGREIGSLAINPSLFGNSGFDPRRDFAPIGLIAAMPVAIVANPSFPAKTIGELLTLGRF